MRYLLPKKEKLQKGQTVLIVLLVMTVLLTLGLSAVSRSVTDVKISQQTQESARALWTAQAGLEKAMLAQSEMADTIDGVDYVVTMAGLGGVEEFLFPGVVSPGESVDYWLVGHDSDGNIDTTDFYSGNYLTVYWGNTGNTRDTTTALIVTFIYKDAVSGLFRSQKFTYDPLVGRIPATGFTAVSAGGKLAGTDFAHLTGQIPVPEQTYFAVIKMLFNTTPQILGVETRDTIPGPVQGSCFESTARVVASNIVRRVRVCRTWPKTPEIFDYLLFSGEDLKNE